MPNDFNRAVIASDALSGRAVAVASQLTGTGHTLGDLDAGILNELVERGEDGLAPRVGARLTAAGRSLERDGKPIKDQTEQGVIMAQACEAFCRTSLRQFLQLGIVSPG